MNKLTENPKTNLPLKTRHLVQYSCKRCHCWGNTL